MEKRQIVISDLEKLLDDGKSRKEINEIYGLNPKEAQMVWKHPRLVGKKKAKHTIGIVLVDEVDDLNTDPIDGEHDNY